MDLATPEGFSNALWAVATLKPGGGHLTAPVCSTFVIVNLRDLGSTNFILMALLFGWFSEPIFQLQSNANPPSFTWH